MTFSLLIATRAIGRLAIVADIGGRQANMKAGRLPHDEDGRVFERERWYQKGWKTYSSRSKMMRHRAEVGEKLAHSDIADGRSPSVAEIDIAQSSLADMSSALVNALVPLLVARDATNAGQWDRSILRKNA